MSQQKAKKSLPHRSAKDLSLRRVRSALTNGSCLFGNAEVDERGAWSRRFRDLLHAYHSDLGGADRLSEGQKALARRAAMLQLQLEMVESRWAESEDGKAGAHALHRYQTATNTLRRVIESLELNKGPKVVDVTGRALAMLEASAA